MLSVFCASGEKTFIMSVYCLVQQQLETILILVGEEDEREGGGVLSPPSGSLQGGWGSVLT